MTLYLKPILISCSLTVLAACAAQPTTQGVIYAEPTYDKFGTLECDNSNSSVTGSAPVFECIPILERDPEQPGDEPEPVGQPVGQTGAQG